MTREEVKIKFNLEPGDEGYSDALLGKGKYAKKVPVKKTITVVKKKPTKKYSGLGLSERFEDELKALEAGQPMDEETNGLRKAAKKIRGAFTK